MCFKTTNNEDKKFIENQQRKSTWGISLNDGINTIKHINLNRGGISDVHVWKH